MCLHFSSKVMTLSGNITASSIDVSMPLRIVIYKYFLWWQGTDIFIDCFAMVTVTTSCTACVTCLVAPDIEYGVHISLFEATIQLLCVERITLLLCWNIIWTPCTEMTFIRPSVPAKLILQSHNIILQPDRHNPPISTSKQGTGSWVVHHLADKGIQVNTLNRIETKSQRRETATPHWNRIPPTLVTVPGNNFWQKRTWLYILVYAKVHVL